MFFQNDDRSDICDGFVRLLELDDDAEWRAAVDTAFDVQGMTYDWTPELYASFDASVGRYLADQPEVARRISELVHSPS